MKQKYSYAVVLLFLFATSISAKEKNSITKFPDSISKECRNGIAKIYDECSDQNNVLNPALESVTESGKSVLIVYGAEWCIWCHVFDKYIDGMTRAFDYEWEYNNKIQSWKMLERVDRNVEAEAKRLSKYVSENFIIAHIEGEYSPNGPEVMQKVGIGKEELFYMPLIAVLDSNGKVAGIMPQNREVTGLEVRQDTGQEYRGYDREILLAVLTELRRKAIQ